MKSVVAFAFAAGWGGLAAGASFDRSLFRRWDYNLCDCTLSGVPLPDKDNFQLPLENNWSEQCPPTYIGDSGSPSATSRVCLDFIGPYLYFNFSAFPGYTTKSAKVTWKLMGNMIQPADWSSPPPESSLDCAPGADGKFICKLPFSDILAVSPSTNIKALLAGMCPNGDREGLGFYFQFTGQAVATDSTVTFTQQYPCKTRDSNYQCTAWDTSYNYIEVSYRCTDCSAAECPSSTTTTADTCPTPPPTTTSCDFGTAFGYTQKSFTLDTQPGQGCNRWGWYMTPTLAELQSGTGIGGPLYVGAGKNDISKATNVGTWQATANSAGLVTVTYTTKLPYTISEAHVDLECLPIDKCAPGSYTYGADGLHGVTWANPVPLKYPSCGSRSKAALIVHAAISATGNACH